MQSRQTVLALFIRRFNPFLGLVKTARAKHSFILQVITLLYSGRKRQLFCGALHWYCIHVLIHWCSAVVVCFFACCSCHGAFRAVLVVLECDVGFLWWVIPNLPLGNKESWNLDHCEKRLTSCSFFLHIYKCNPMKSKNPKNKKGSICRAFAPVSHVHWCFLLTPIESEANVNTTSWSSSARQWWGSESVSVWLISGQKSLSVGQQQRHQGSDQNKFSAVCREKARTFSPLISKINGHIHHLQHEMGWNIKVQQ